MANTDLVRGWNEYALLATESTFGTGLLPAIGQGLEVISADMGPSEVGDTRPKKDKTLGRDMTLAFVEGRVKPIPFSIETSIKSRASAGTIMKEAVLLKAAGLTGTLGASDVYSISSAPTLTSLSFLRTAGSGTNANLGEWGQGGIIKNLAFALGDKELTLKASGAFAKKTTLGAIDSVSCLIGATTLVVTAEECYRIGLGYYQIENEVVLVTANDYATTLTITRAQASTSAAAHTSVPMNPYIPAPTLAGSPISEVNAVCTIDAIATRCTKFSIDIDTGMDHLPGETGSKYVQGSKVTRIGIKAQAELVLTTQFVALLQKAQQRKAVALSIVCGTTAGGIFTFSMPYTEVMPFATPMPGNDDVFVTVPFRVRGSAGNDSFTLTAT